MLQRSLYLLEDYHKLLTHCLRLVVKLAAIVDSRATRHISPILAILTQKCCWFLRGFEISCRACIGLVNAGRTHNLKNRVKFLYLMVVSVNSQVN